MYNENSKKRTMKYLATLKEIRFRVKPEEYGRFEKAAKKGNYKSLRQFFLSAIREKADLILGKDPQDFMNEPITQDEIQHIPAGEWIEDVLGGCKCSKCGEKPYPFQTDSAEDDYWQPKYCPNCGEKMKQRIGENSVLPNEIEHVPAEDIP